MAEELASLLEEPDLPGDEPRKLAYPNLLWELSLQAMARRPRYDYRDRSAAEVRARLTEVRRMLRRCLGLSARDLPARPRRVIERPPVAYDGYSITPVAIERAAGWHITAHLYLPEGLTRPGPAVLHVHGHSYDGKSAPFYARRCRALARRGFAVLFVDFPGAGERAGTGHALWYPVLANMPLQGIMVSDNSAALTYLASHPLVDGARIGVTGSSGGGNQTAFFSALDERVAASAPCNAPTMMWEHANSGSSAWCHCEAVPGLIAAGIEYHDLLAAVAPRPLRVFAGIRDTLFPIIGAREAVARAQPAYQALGVPSNCGLAEHYTGHACPLVFREELYRFFERALRRPGDHRGPGGEGEDIDLSDPRLQALPTSPPRFLGVPDLYRARLRMARPGRPTAAQLNRLLGRPTRGRQARTLMRREDAEWSRVLLQTDDGAVLPVVMRRSKGRPAILIIADKGKEQALAELGLGRAPVVAVDLRGQGETAPADDAWYQRATHYLALAGEPLPGGRVSDLIAVWRWLQEEGLSVGKIVAVGGEACLLASLAAAVQPKLPPIELRGMPRSLRDAPGLVGQVPYTAWVPNLALLTDVPQLLRALGKRATVKRWLKPGEEPEREGYT